MSKSPITDLIAEANSWRNEDPNADSTEQVSEEVTSLIVRLADALEFVTDNYVLKSWSGLFEILNEAYPEDVFLTLPNNESRDSGPRIVSLIRLLDRERTRAEVAESRLEAVTVPTAGVIEAAARAGYEYLRAKRPETHGPYDSWEELDESYREYLRGVQRAALSAAGFRLPALVEPEATDAEA